MRQSVFCLQLYLCAIVFFGKSLSIKVLYGNSEKCHSQLKTQRLCFSRENLCHFSPGCKLESLYCLNSKSVSTLAPEIK